MNLHQLLRLIDYGNRAGGRGGSKRITLLIVGLVIAYALLQPVLQRTFGWNLPGLGGDDAPRQAERDDSPGGIPPAERTSPPKAEAEPDSGGDAPRGTVLRDVGRDVFESPAGLRYTRGSAEGHRVKHVLRHAEDQPRRPGKHGVFDARGEEVFVVIDEAYERARQGGRGVRTEREGSRTVHTVDLGRRVGYVGGQVGNSRGRPPARKVRMVLEGQNVITAFPTD